MFKIEDTIGDVILISFRNYEDLKDFGIKLQVCDPVVDPVELKKVYETNVEALDDLLPSRLVIYAVAHEHFKDLDWEFYQQRLLIDGKGAVIDVRAALPRDCTPEGVVVWRL